MQTFTNLLYIKIPVIDPDRLLYVAGYDQDTPVAVQIQAPGRFTYQITTDGDGRVPHALGLLEGVETFWVRESHGGLPKNPNVLAAVHDLLQAGATTALESSKPPPASRHEPVIAGRQAIVRTAIPPPAWRWRP